MLIQICLCATVFKQIISEIIFKLTGSHAPDIIISACHTELRREINFRSSQFPPVSFYIYGPVSTPPSNFRKFPSFFNYFYILDIVRIDKIKTGWLKNRQERRKRTGISNRNAIYIYKW